GGAGRAAEDHGGLHSSFAERYSATSISFSHRATAVAIERSEVTLGTVRIMSRIRSKGRTKPTTTAVWAGVIPMAWSTAASTKSEPEGTGATPSATIVVVPAITK